MLATTACTGGGAEDPCAEISAPYEITSVAQQGSLVRLEVGYSGGCEPHEFVLRWSGVGAPSDPPQFPLELHHDAHGDACEAYLTLPLWLDLAELSELGGFTHALVTLYRVVPEALEPKASISFVTGQPPPPSTDSPPLGITRECAVIGLTR